MTRTVYMLTTGRYYMIRLGIDIMHLHMMFMNVSLISASNVENNKKKCNIFEDAIQSSVHDHDT